MSSKANSHFSATSTVRARASFAASPKRRRARASWSGPEDPDLRQEPVALGRVRDLFLDGAEEDEALGAGQVLDGVGPDDGQAGEGIGDTGNRGHVPISKIPVRVPRFPKTLGNSRTPPPSTDRPARPSPAARPDTRPRSANHRPPGPRRGHVPLVPPFWAVPSFKGRVPVFGLGGRISPVRHVDHDESRRVADLAPVEDLHEVRIALRGS